MKKLLSLLATSCILIPMGHAVLSHSYTSSVSGVTGLYDTSGAQTTSSVNITAIRYTLTYDVTTTTPGIFPMTINYIPVSGVWKTKIQVMFSNTGWQTAPSGSRFWVQVCNYIEGSGTYISSEQSYLSLPTYSGLVTKPSSSTYAINNWWADVTPKEFAVSGLTLDSGDVTGKTGYYEWNSTSLAPAPWDLLPSNPTTIYRSANSGENWFGVIWAFAKPDTYAQSSLYNGITIPYPIPPIE